MARQGGIGVDTFEPTAPAATVGVPAHGPPTMDIEIVPRKGLPFVAIAVLFVIYAIASNSRWALTF
ncbi:MAG: hypothetical protein JST64_09295, partial [Actinobacteria bacterium]|nr:hypothetical protein [Actinomycetota bacterium]